jgi:hypothetical protein
VEKAPRGATIQAKCDKVEPFPRAKTKSLKGLLLAKLARRGAGLTLQKHGNNLESERLASLAGK